MGKCAKILAVSLVVLNVGNISVFMELYMVTRTNGALKTNSLPVYTIGKSRVLYIDNLRATLITFVILLHLAITHGADGGWIQGRPRN